MDNRTRRFYLAVTMNVHLSLSRAVAQTEPLPPHAVADKPELWRDQRRHNILAAAGRVFARLAFEQASMDEIAGEAGVGKPTLYRYFASKDALFAAVFEEALDDLEAELSRVLREVSGARDRLDAMVKALVPTVREHLAALRFLGDSAAGADQSKRRVFRERRSRIADYLRRTLEEGAASGELRPVNGARVGQILIGMVWSATVAIDATDDELGRDIVDLVLSGLLQTSRLGPASAWHEPDTIPLRRGARS